MSDIDDTFYDLFARHARNFGLEVAVAAFEAKLPDDVETYAARWRENRDRIIIADPPIIAAGQEVDWYCGPTGDDLYWPALERHFKALGWDEERIRAVDRSSSKVVAHTPRPDTQKFRARGLVVGYVQSGKTTNYTAVAAKMADVGYQFVLVLSGIHNGLRLQTQERLDEQLVGLQHSRWLTLTGEQDFHPRDQNPSALLGAPDRVTLAVVKKNTTVLKRLKAWFEKKPGRDALARTRVLVIDDEADQASVATESINPLIKDILALMPRHTYIGYTATPFANVFIDPASDDLYPKDFILNLPQPDGYFGPEQVFGRDSFADDPGSGGKDMIRRIPDDDVHLLRPKAKEPAESFTPTITDEVRDALRWFWLASAARRARGDAGHSTMLVHTSIKTAVHESFRRPLQHVLQRHRDELAAGDERLISELRAQWLQEVDRVPATQWGREQNTFEQVLAHLPEVLNTCKVVLDNSQSDDRLDYSGDPVVAIAVGGNTLSRGLTLEGLVVSVFVRGAKTYDTLLQMGRWFGYRTGYEDLPRVWTTEELETAFRHLAQVEMEMRADIDRYQQQNCTPLDLAVRIRTHPQLQITAKMGAAAPAEISYAGSRLQTRYFNRLDPDLARSNQQAGERLVSLAARAAERSTVGEHIVFHGVGASAVKEFLRSYRFQDDQADLNPDMLCSYIDREISNRGALDQWNVVLVQGSQDPVGLGPEQVRTSIRARVRHTADTDEGRDAAAVEETADIKTLMSRRDIAHDLSDAASLPSTTAESELMRRRENDPLTRNRGLVVLYLIDRRSEPSVNRRHSRVAMDAVDYLLGCGIVFPGRDGAGARVRTTHLAVDLSDVETEDRSQFEDDDTPDTDS